MGFRVGIDSGGTFTDLQALDEGGKMHIIKVPSTPKSPDLGFRHALESLKGRLNGQKIDAVLHGTTVAVNAILQRQFPPIGLVVTKGFRHILELARQTVPGERGSIYVWVKPPRLVPLKNVRELSERLNYKGEVLAPFDEAECRALARWYKEQGIGTIAICFINAYANGAHERRARDIFREEYPGSFVSISSETLPEFREYERAVTTCMNALLMPLLGRYVANLQKHMKDLGIEAPLYMMKSGGGASRADLAIEKPVYTALSGPSAAVVGSAWLGRESGIPDIITFDMGGTSTDVSLIKGGYPSMVTEAEIDVYPIRTPSIDVISVGAGGGSLAWLAPGDRLHVGPRSAGAEPGPACYGRGGKEPTITDANYYLGRLPRTLAGGMVRLDRTLAENALRDLGEKIGLTPLEMANGIIEIGELNMADAIRQVSVRKGRDPRLFTLVAGGGAGPLHAASLGEILRIPQVMIPPNPGIGCSLGALVSDVREDFVMTDIQRESDLDVARLKRHFGELETQAEGALKRQGFATEHRQIVRSADMRYRGMRTELTVPVPGGAIDEGLVKAMIKGLHDAHQSEYGYSYEGTQQVEVVNLRVAGLGRMREVAPFRAKAAGDVAAAIVGRQQVYFGKTWSETPLYDRDKLGEGATFEGPAIIQQYDSTTLVLPGQRVRVDRCGNLLIETNAGRRQEAA
ncbi:MAG: hydantoinase/oxoprolinase family protein [Alphaproteobacteria bacterium]|nr:hydantoinase/oxoprolinase family protein [Alphaproteobacteria bacterium]